MTVVKGSVVAATIGGGAVGLGWGEDGVTCVAKDRAAAMLGALVDTGVVAMDVIGAVVVDRGRACKARSIGLSVVVGGRARKARSIGLSVVVVPRGRFRNTRASGFSVVVGAPPPLPTPAIPRKPTTTPAAINDAAAASQGLAGALLVCRSPAWVPSPPVAARGGDTTHTPSPSPGPRPVPPVFNSSEDSATERASTDPTPSSRTSGVGSPCAKSRSS